MCQNTMVRNPEADVSLAQVGEVWGSWAVRAVTGCAVASEPRAPTSPKRGPQAGGAISVCHKYLNEMPLQPHPEL